MVACTDDMCAFAACVKGRNGKRAAAEGPPAANKKARKK